jgi:hypothetical protein
VVVVVVLVQVLGVQEDRVVMVVQVLLLFATKEK